MADNRDFNKQFDLDKSYYLKQMDFLNWFRYYYLVKEVLGHGPRSILEVGTGSGMVKSCLSPHVDEYRVLDINEKLKPDFLGDLRGHMAELDDRFDCLIAADVLEHMPFEDMGANLKNILSYLHKGGRALITIPHRRSNFLFMSPSYVPHVFTVPTGFLSLGGFYRRFIKRKIWIDPDHCWEIGDGNIKRKHVEAEFLEAGFEVEEFKKLLYVDYWVLRKP